MSEQVTKRSCRQPKPLPSQEVLRKIFLYNPETGIFVANFYRSPNAIKGSIAGTLNSMGYIVISLDGKLYLAHRLAWMYVYGREPRDAIDHINGIKTDNSISNLREVSMAENGFNAKMPKSNASGIKGVGWRPNRNKWRARITAYGKEVCIGHFNNIDDATAAINQAREKLHGEFANHG